MKIHRLLFAFVLAATIACGSNPLAPVPDNLQTVPLSVNVDGRSLRMVVDAYRNLAPSIGTADTSLTLYITLETIDGAPVPSALTVDLLAAFNGQAVWNEARIEELSRSSRLALRVTGGPKWELQSTVSVVVRVSERGKHSKWLRAPDRQITPLG